MDRILFTEKAPEQQLYRYCSGHLYDIDNDLGNDAMIGEEGKRYEVNPVTGGSLLGF